MKILNKEQFAETPIGTVFCLFTPSILDGDIYVKSGFNSVIPLCPYFSFDEYTDKPSMKTAYYTDCFSKDTSLCDFEDSQLFAVFSKSEARRMIDVLTYALCDCEGKCITDEDCYIID